MKQRDNTKDAEQIRSAVRAGYSKVASSSGCCGTTGCCTGQSQPALIAESLGYSAVELETLPSGANLGLGCGNPTAIEGLEKGQTVLDLGSGAGIDVFLAARAVGPAGKVIGVDMTDAMLEKARKNAKDGGYDNVEFRKGNIEQLPVEDGSVDVILSNCVVNLSPEKDQVFLEAYRVLRPGGRIQLSDIVLDKTLPEAIAQDVASYVGCVSGAVVRERYVQHIRDAGFNTVEVLDETGFSQLISAGDPMVEDLTQRLGLSEEKVKDAVGSIKSVHVVARK